jgi:superfamily II DNA/RNA helicase
VGAIAKLHHTRICAVTAQIEKEVRAFSHTCGRSVRSCIVVGGVAMQEQRHDLRGGVEIVVATPGRFIDHLQQGNTNLDRISFVVLDEADRCLDMGFEPQVWVGGGATAVGRCECLSPVADSGHYHNGVWSVRD